VSVIEGNWVRRLLLPVGVFLSVLLLLIFRSAANKGENYAVEACKTFKRADSTLLPDMTKYKPDSFTSRIEQVAGQQVPHITWHYSTFSKDLHKTSTEVKKLLSQAEMDAASAAKRSSKFENLSALMTKFSSSFWLDRMNKESVSNGIGIGIKPSDYNSELATTDILPSTVEQVVSFGNFAPANVEALKQECLIVLAK
jgi:hypothetical protein